MTLRMADAVYAQNLIGIEPPPDAYAGYDDGNWPDFEAIAAEHPGAHLLELTVWLANRGEGIDDEPGDASDAQTVTYVGERLAGGEWRPVVYASISRMANIVALQTAAGHARSSYRLLAAHYTGKAHICGPTTCGASVQVDGTQWIDHGPWDESLLADDFFGGEPAPTTSTTQQDSAPASSAPPPTIQMEGVNVQNTLIPVTTDANGNGAVICDGSAPEHPLIPFAQCYGVGLNSSDPFADQPPYEPGYAKRQERGGNVLITVIGAPPNSDQNVWVTWEPTPAA